MSDSTTNDHQHEESVSYLVSCYRGADGRAAFEIGVLKPSAVCLSEDLKVKWDEETQKWVLYDSKVKNDTTIYCDEVGSLTRTTDTYELTIVAEDNHTVSISEKKDDCPRLPQLLYELKKKLEESQELAYCAWKWGYIQPKLDLKAMKVPPSFTFSVCCNNTETKNPVEITPEFDSESKTFKGLKVEIARSVVQTSNLHQSFHRNTWSDEKRRALLRFMPFLVAMAILEKISEYYPSIVQSTAQDGPTEQNEEICIRGL